MLWLSFNQKRTAEQVLRVLEVVRGPASHSQGRKTSFRQGQIPSGGGGEVPAIEKIAPDFLYSRVLTGAYTLSALQESLRVKVYGVIMDVRTNGDLFSDQEANWELKRFKNGMALSISSGNNWIEIVLSDEEVIQLVRNLAVPVSQAPPDRRS